MSEVATAVLIAMGVATRYNPGVVEAVVANRIEWGQLPPHTEAARCVALLDRQWLGHTVWVETPEHKLVGPLFVCDCAAEHDRERLRQAGFAVDLSWQLAKELGVVDRVGRDFRVWSDNPRQPGVRLAW